MEDWALIRRLAAEGVPKARIARRLGISRTTVIKAIAADGPPKYERKPAPTSFTPYEARVRELLEETPDMPATVLAERVGWTGSIRWFRDNVKQLRSDHRPIDPADRLTWTVGDVAQCDLWFPPRKILLEDGSRTLLPVLVMTCGYSRYMLGRMIPTRKTPDLFLGSWALLDQLGRVPRRLIWDNEPGIGRGKLTEPALDQVGREAAQVQVSVVHAARAQDAGDLLDVTDHDVGDVRDGLGQLLPGRERDGRVRVRRTQPPTSAPHEDRPDRPGIGSPAMRRPGTGVGGGVKGGSMAKTCASITSEAVRYWAASQSSPRCR